MDITKHFNNFWSDMDRFFDRDYYTSTPAHNLVKTDKGYELEIYVPGFDKKEITVEQDGHFLVIRGRHEEEDKKYKHRGYIQRSFEKRLYVRDGASISNASLANGVLTIPVAVANDEKEVKQIAVK
jgi:HSP20 family molecular chaperone IbpA